MTVPSHGFPTARFAYDPRPTAAPCFELDENKKPSISFRHAGHLVLATSYSRTTLRRTTIGAAAFHCRVRNGNGWDHCAMITRSKQRAWSLFTSGVVIREARIVTSKSSRFTIHALSKNCCFSDIYTQGTRFVIRYIITSVLPIHDSRFNDSRNIKSFVFDRGQRPRLQLF